MLCSNFINKFEPLNTSSESGTPNSNSSNRLFFLQMSLNSSIMKVSALILICFLSHSHSQNISGTFCEVKRMPKWYVVDNDVERWVWSVPKTGRRIKMVALDQFLFLRRPETLCNSLRCLFESLLWFMCTIGLWIGQGYSHNFIDEVIML